MCSAYQHSQFSTFLHNPKSKNPGLFLDFSSQRSNISVTLYLEKFGYCSDPEMAQMMHCKIARQYERSGAKDNGGGGDNTSCMPCKAPVKSSPSTNQHSVYLQATGPSCRPANSALKSKSITFYRLAQPISQPCL